MVDRTNTFLAARDMVEQALANNAILRLYIEQDEVGDKRDNRMDVQSVRRHFRERPPVLFVADLPGTKMATTKLNQYPQITVNRKLVHAHFKNDMGLSFRRYVELIIKLLRNVKLIRLDRLVFTIFVTVMHELSHYKVRYNGYVKISPSKFNPRRSSTAVDQPESGKQEFPLTSLHIVGFWMEARMFGGLVFPFDLAVLLSASPETAPLRLQRSTSESSGDGMVVQDDWIFDIVKATLEGNLRSMINSTGTPLRVRTTYARDYAPLEESTVFAHCGTADGRL